MISALLVLLGFGMIAYGASMVSTEVLIITVGFILLFIGFTTA